tara:strand:- start:1289 stop:1405 length:117 start_codon:yes stop_codon:yes gene_type:complete
MFQDARPLLKHFSMGFFNYKKKLETKVLLTDNLHEYIK